MCEELADSDVSSEAISAIGGRAVVSDKSEISKSGSDDREEGLFFLMDRENSGDDSSLFFVLALEIGVSSSVVL